MADKTTNENGGFKVPTESEIKAINKKFKGLAASYGSRVHVSILPHIPTDADAQALYDKIKGVVKKDEAEKHSENSGEQSEY